MANPERSIDRLREAISEEKNDTEQREAALRMLTAKMHAYQMGNGPAPTIEEFTRWRDATEKHLLVRRIQSGVP